jgi:hypothetical protein
VSRSANKPPAYDWKEVRERLLKGVTYAPGNPFHYRHQLRLKVSSNALIFTFWDFAKCMHSALLQGGETSLWEQFDLEVRRRNIFEIPCVSVCASVWSDMPILLRPDPNASVPLDIVNRALREHPEKIRRDLQVNGIYGFTAMPCDSSKTFIFGVPLGYALKGALSKLPKEWAKTAWYGPTAIPTLQQQQPGNFYHTVLLRSTALSMMVQAGKMRFLQQDRALVEDQPISQGSLSRLKSVYSYFAPGEVKHLLYPIEVSRAWTNTLRACIQGMGAASEVQIVSANKLKVPGVPEDAIIQDMFPTGLPWS